MKRNVIMWACIFLSIGAVMCGCETNNSTAKTTHIAEDQNEEGKQMEEIKLVSKEYLLEHTDITEEDLEAIDIDEFDIDTFIEYWGFTEENLYKYKVKNILMKYIEHKRYLPQINYEYMFEAPEAKLEQSDIDNIVRIAWFQNMDLSAETLAIDFESGILYYCEGYNMSNLQNNAVEGFVLSQAQKNGILSCIQDADAVGWAIDSPPVDSKDTDSSSWKMAFEMKDGRIAKYGGFGGVLIPARDIADYIKDLAGVESYM